MAPSPSPSPSHPLPEVEHLIETPNFKYPKPRRIFKSLRPLKSSLARLFLLLSFLVLLVLLPLPLPLPLSRSSLPHSPVKHPRLALCLAGGLREFELTAPSIQAHLFHAYKNLDVFVVTPLDSTAWKVRFLNGSNVVAVHIAEQLDVPLNDVIEQVIAEHASPKGRQGLLHYIKLLEACKEIILEYEILKGFKYEWVLRTRPDTVWSGPPEPIENYSLENFYIPPGSDWWGINDRFTLGGREWSLASLAGMSSIPGLYLRGMRALTSEEKFLADLANADILPNLRRPHFPFCVLTKRTWDFPPKSLMDGRVAPLGSRSARDGAYCWPCERETNKTLLREVPMELFGMTEYCNLLGLTSWPSNWKELFRGAVGERLFEAYLSLERERERERPSCVSHLQAFLQTVPIQKGGFTAERLCHLGFPETMKRKFWRN